MSDVKEIKFKTWAYQEGEVKKTTFDIWEEVCEVYPDKHVAIKKVLYDDEGMVEAEIEISDK